MTAHPVAPARIEDLVRRQAARHADRLALSGPGGAVTYGELENSADELAARLSDGGVQPGDPVAVWLPRSVGQVIAVLACWHAGAVCVPIDPALPRLRIETMLRVTGCRLAIRGQQWLEPLDGLHPVTNDRALAYVFFTSGSSAEPKAVGLPHAGVVNEAQWTGEAFGLSERDKTSWLSSPGFAISRWELWSALAAGACVRIAEEGIEWSASATQNWLTRERVTWSVVVTSLAERLFDLPWPSDGALQTLVTGGEQLRKWPEGLPFTVVNSYGVTETSGVRSAAWLPREPPSSGLPGIGWPIANTELYVLGEDLAPLPPGVTGELHVGGYGLAHGYLGQPGRTAERFVPDPFRTDGGRMYRTGDLARRHADGNVDFVGRSSAEVKIDGVRVNVTEVESVLLSHPDVAATAVAVVSRAGRPRLVAHVVARSGATPTGHQLRAFLAQRLPRTLVPSSYAVVAALPLLPSGKLDRARLPDPDAGGDRGFTECADETERAVADAFRTVLGVTQPISAHDDFFGLGGDSLGLVEVWKLLAHEVSLGILFEARTPRGIAGALRPRSGPHQPDSAEGFLEGAGTDRASPGAGEEPLARTDGLSDTEVTALLRQLLAERSD